jgi:hypothetical protein
MAIFSWACADGASATIAPRNTSVETILENLTIQILSGWNAGTLAQPSVMKKTLSDLTKKSSSKYSHFFRIVGFYACLAHNCDGR